MTPEWTSLMKWKIKSLKNVYNLILDRYKVMSMHFPFIGSMCVSLSFICIYKCLDMRLPYRRHFPTCCAWFVRRKSTRRPGHQDRKFSPLLVSSADAITRIVRVLSSPEFIEKNCQQSFKFLPLKVSWSLDI